MPMQYCMPFERIQKKKKTKYCWNVKLGTGESLRELERIWNRLQTFPHVFELAAARGTLMDLDLNGQRKTKEATSISHVTYRRWKVVFKEYEMLLLKGTLEPSMFEFLANVFRQHLPKDVFLHRPHVLRSQKTGPQQLPKHNAAPRIQVFP